MSGNSLIKLDLQNNGILVLTIDRAAQYNTLNSATLEELERVIEQARNNFSVRALLVTGAGNKAFIAGADINEFKFLTSEQSLAFSERGQRIFQSLEDMPVPVLAAINGFALGGGCELALACHIRIASDQAQIGLPEVKLGIIPGYGGTQRLTRLVGKGRALELMLTGNPITAEEAMQIGLVNRVVPAANLLPVSVNLLSQILERAPLALAKILEATAAAQMGGKEGYRIEATAFEACCHSTDFQEGVSAFVEKREPIFKGV